MNNESFLAISFLHPKNAYETSGIIFDIDTYMVFQGVAFGKMEIKSFSSGDKNSLNYYFPVYSLSFIRTIAKT